ncbi:MAG: TonB-dependent receptor, partial [Paludibacteraceae bacterium]|nr:TonB-dependent receptor [Paludibacteraceae bacterium]
DVKSFTVYFDGQEEDLFMTYFGSLGLKFTPTSSTELELLSSAFHTAEEVSYDISGSYWMSESVGEMTFDAAAGVGNYHEHARDKLNATVFNISHLGRQKWDKNELHWGITYQRELVFDKINEWEWRDSAGYSLPLSNTAMTLYNNINSDVNMYSNRVSAYLQERFKKSGKSGKMTLDGGLRVSYWDFNKEWLISPRVSFAWFPKKNSNWGFRFATGIYYQTLFYKEMRQLKQEENGNQEVVLNYDIKSPRSYQLLAASDYYFRKWNRPFKFSVEMYGKYLDRIIPYIVENTQVTYLGKNCADGYAYGIDLKLFGEFVPGTDSWVSFSYMQTKENIYGDDMGYIPRPTDQRYNVSLFFQDYFPQFKQLKFNLKLIWSDGLPFGPPQNLKYKSAFRMNDYRRVDLGATYQLVRGQDRIMTKKFFSWMRSLSFNLDVFNLLDIDNENSFYWVTDAYGQQYAVPNYLTGRRINFKLAIEF